MKKIIFIIVIVILLAGGFLFLQNRGLVPMGGPVQYEVENVLPQNPLIFLEMRNGRKNIDKFTETLFWKRLSQINYDLILSSSKLTRNEQVAFEVLKVAFENPEENEIFDKFFSKDAALAIYSADIDLEMLTRGDPNLINEMFEEIASNFYLVTRLGAEAQLAEFVSRAFNQFGEEVKTEDVTYKGHTIKLVSVEEMPYKFGYTRLKDLMVMGVGEKAVQKSIDVFLGNTEPLINDEAYLAAKNRFVKNPELLTYWNMAGFFAEMEEQMKNFSQYQDSQDAQVRYQIEQTFASVKGFKSVGVSTRWDDLLETKIDFLFNKEHMEAGMARFYENCRNVDNKSLKLIPQDALAYQWGNCFDLTYYWEEYKKELERAPRASGQPSVMDQIAQYERMIGLTIEGDILPAFGVEIGGYLKDIQVDQNFPIPELLLLIKINDQAKAEKVLGLLKNSPMAMFQNENHNGIDINYLSIPMAGNISPGYCFVNDFLLIAVNKDLLTGSIDVAKKGAASIVGNESFKKVDRGLTGNNMGIQFYKVDDIAFKLTSIIDWSDQYMAANNQKKEAFKSGAERRLKQVQNNIENAETDLKKKESEITTLEAEIKSLKDAGESYSFKEMELSDLNQNVVDLKSDIEDDIQEAIQLQQTVQGYDSSSMTSDKRSLYMEGVINPIIDSLKSIDGIGAYSSMTEDSLESKVYINL